MTELDDYDEMFHTHFDRDADEGTDNELAELARKVVALFEIYFTDITKSLNEIKVMVNEIMSNGKKVQTVQDIWESSNMELRAFDTVPSKSVVQLPSTQSDASAAINEEISSKVGTLVGGGQSMSSSDITPITSDLHPDAIIMPRAHVGKTAKIGKGAYVGYLAYVCNNVTLHDEVILSDVTYVPFGTEVPKGTFVIDETDTVDLVDMLHDFLDSSIMDAKMFNAKVGTLLSFQDDAL